MKEYDFKIIHEEGRLFAEVNIRGKVSIIDVTSYFEKDEAIEEWLWYRRKKRLEKR